jgi:tetratricopeptide (TPR) repeat protein
MNPATGSNAPGERPFFLGRWWPPVFIILAGSAAYANSLSGPFVFDDVGSIVDNQSLRHLSSVGSVLSPPAGGLTVSGRPGLNLTLALNYAWGGSRVQGYHAVNLAIHLLAGLTLFGIARRTLRSRPALAWAIALLWTVHPLATEAVTYVVQRAESLMSLCYLLTIYGLIRFAEGREGPSSFAKDSADQEAARGGWAALAILACLFGMATKEVMVSAPVIALLYDRTFLAGSFREAWRRRRGLYLGLASTWVLLAILVIGGGGGRSGSAGFGVGISWWAYGLTQFEAITRYLQLAVWPRPLVFEYGTFWARDAGQVLPYAAVVLALLAATVVALRRWPVWGFLGCWFFALLAPTSLVPGTTQMIVEHRMYLALAPLLAALVGGGAAALRRLFPRAAGPAAGAVLAILTAACVLATASRNADYYSELSLWADTAAKRPESALAHNNLGAALEKAGRTADATAQFEEALRLDPGFEEAHNNLGNIWLKTPSRLPQAVAEYRAALLRHFDFAEAHNNLGNALSRLPGNSAEAIAEYQTALRLKPAYAGAHNNLGKAWMALPGRSGDAIAEFNEALRLQPDFAEAHNNLGNAWAGQPGRLEDAIAQFREALRLRPDFAEAHNNLGNAWSQSPARLGDAIAQLQTALRLQPDFPEAHNNLGNAWQQVPGRLDDAVAEYQTALQLRPDYAEAHYNLAAALLRLPGRAGEARAHLEAFLRLRPDNVEARQVLASLQAPPP